MAFTTNRSWLAPRLIDALYTEALLLADEAHAYFESAGAAERDALPPVARITYACEAMRITMRLTHIVTWLLARRTIDAGDLPAAVARDQPPRLKRADESDPAVYLALPAGARTLIEASRDLYQRTARLEADIDYEGTTPSPVHQLLNRLEHAF
jgi:regulator of CtrA degradation